jgi:hypothetical protein
MYMLGDFFTDSSGHLDIRSGGGINAPRPSHWGRPNIEQSSMTKGLRGVGETILWLPIRFRETTRHCFRQGCLIFIGVTYQSGKSYTKWPQNIPNDDNGDKIHQMAIKYTQKFHSKALKTKTKLLFFVCKFTIWQPRLSAAALRVIRTDDPDKTRLGGCSWAEVALKDCEQGLKRVIYMLCKSSNIFVQ